MKAFKEADHPRTAAGRFRAKAVTVPPLSDGLRAQVIEDPVLVTTVNEEVHLHLPSVSFARLYHVGSLDPSDKRESSLEGAGLSVSQVPEAWEEIARLGSAPWWAFEREGNHFVDAHSLSPEQRERIVDWGVEKGYVRRSDRWKVSWYDDELDEEVFLLFDTEEEALDEECGPPERVKDVVPTETFPDPAGRLNADQVIVAVWAEEETDFDGVYWDDRLDPVRLSAPRAVIFKSRLGRWKSRPYRT